MSAPSAMSRSLVDRVAPLSRERFGDLPVGARAVLCLYGALYVLAIVWAVPKCSLAGIVPLLVVLTAAGLERGWSDPAGQKVFIAGSGVRMVVTLICPPEALLVGGLGSGLGSGLRRGWAWPTAANVSMWALGTALASAVRLWVLAHAGPVGWVALTISIVTALAVYSLANILLCSVLRGARYRRPFPGEWSRNVRTHWPTNLTHLPLVAALAALALQVREPVAPHGAPGRVSAGDVGATGSTDRASLRDLLDSSGGYSSAVGVDRRERARCGRHLRPPPHGARRAR